MAGRRGARGSFAQRQAQSAADTTQGQRRPAGGAGGARQMGGRQSGGMRDDDSAELRVQVDGWTAETLVAKLLRRGRHMATPSRQQSLAGGSGRPRLERAQRHHIAAGNACRQPRRRAWRQRRRRRRHGRHSGHRRLAPHLHNVSCAQRGGCAALHLGVDQHLGLARRQACGAGWGVRPGAGSAGHG